MQRRGGFKRGGKRNTDRIDRGRGGKKRVGRKDESDREEEEAREEVAEMKNRTKGVYFEAFTSSSEEEDEMDNELEQGSEGKSEVEVASEFQINGEYFKTLLKDLRLYDMRLGKLTVLKKSDSLTEEGREFVNQYHTLVSLYCMYSMYYTYLSSQGGTTVHPVLRMLANLREKVKIMDKEYAKHKATATQLIDAFAVEEEESYSQVSMAEDGAEVENGIDELDNGGDESIENEVIGTSHYADRSKKNLAAKQNKPKRQLQVFKLDQGKSYADIHHYNPNAEDSEEDVLNLKVNDSEDKDNEGEITMADLGSFNEHLKHQSKAKKPSQKGRQLYEALASKKTEAKSLSNAMKEETEAALDEYEKKLMFNEKKVKADQPRTLTEVMLLNRGLKQKRKNVISKVKLRHKFEKANRLNRIKKGIRLDEGKNRDIHVLRSLGEGTVRDTPLN